MGGGATEPKLSVVIPTYNRAETLVRCLRAIANQTCSPDDYEVLVVDDGSTDATGERIRSLKGELPFELRAFHQRNAGPATARNVGIENARGHIVLFLGDDIIATPELLQKHIEGHERDPRPEHGLLGFVTWSPELEITPFMTWLERGGPQFHYWRIRDPGKAPSDQFFYTCNVSVKRRFLLDRDLRFDTDFTHAACEDMELGSRMRAMGFELEFVPEAMGHHLHYTSLESCCRRMVTVGGSTLLMEAKRGAAPGDGDRWIARFRLLGALLYRRTIAKACYVPAKYYEKRSLRESHFRRAVKHHQAVGYLSERLRRAARSK